MKTDDLIATLTADNTGPRRSLRDVILAVLAVGAIGAGLVWWAMLGPRPDFMLAMHTARFIFKFIVTLALAGTAAILLFPMSQPLGTPSRLRPLLWVAPVLLVGAVAFELSMVPSSEWMKFWMGHNALVCMASIPVIAALPLALILWGLRQGAPANPARAGALAGLVAGSIAAFFYAAHCFDDSPLFVATWYVIAIAFVTAVGALIGSRVLRW